VSLIGEDPDAEGAAIDHGGTFVRRWSSAKRSVALARSGRNVMEAVDGNAIGGLLHEVFGTEMTDALLRTVVEAVDADEFDVWADSGLVGEAGGKASAAEEQEFRRLIDTAAWQQTSQVLKPPELA
jgi:hypothetical protein